MSQFILKINLGNSHMRDSTDIANALRIISNQLDNGFTARRITDINGNDVGQYLVMMDKRSEIIEVQ